jgi:hypothetical protein
LSAVRSQRETSRRKFGHEHPGPHELAAKINETDVMDSTLEGAREKILQLLDLGKQADLNITAAGN